jgi:transcriptional regulator with XRE-family HTH domain
VQTAHRITKRFGLAVRQVRCQQGLSQEELGYRAGLHRTYIGDIECGRRNATLLSAQRIADALQMPLSELIRIAESLQDE